MSGIIDQLIASIESTDTSDRLEIEGQVTRYDGLMVESSGFPASPGAICDITTQDGDSVQGEVIGFSSSGNLIFLDRQGARIEAGAPVRLRKGGHEMNIGPHVLGRVLDANGAPLDDMPAPMTHETWPLAGKEMNPLARQGVDEVLDVGVRSINTALTVGKGQRVGIIAGSGVGKSVLIQMMTHNTTADVIVVGLIGERAREVGDFVRSVMRGETTKRTCVIAVPADRSPLLRLRAAQRATATAEYFRAQGKQVLLILDSLTRVAHAKRELGLALGEKPTAKGYTPSVISMIPNLIERAGPGLKGEGAITAFYTVLADGDDTNDPVVDTARAILDGHIVLSRAQAQQGIYPAIDIPQSVSRVMNDIVEPDHKRAAMKFRKLVSLYQENRELMLMGGYTEGQDAALDEAIRKWPDIVKLVSQDPHEKSNFAQSKSMLMSVTGGKS